MAQTRKNGSSAAKKSATAKKTGTRKKAPEVVTPPEPPAPPIRRELGAVVFLFLAVFVIISHYNTDGRFIVFFANLIKGLIGWGFWLTVPAFLMAAIILGFHKGQPVALRVTSALMIPIIIAALGSLFFYTGTTDTGDMQLLCGALFEQGQSLQSGGVVGGLIAIGLENAFSLYGAMPVLLVLLVFFTVKCFNGSFIKAFGKARERASVKYDPAMYEKKKPAPAEGEDAVLPLEVGGASPRAAKADRRGAKIERIQRESVLPEISLDDDEELPLADKRGKTTKPYPAESASARPAKKTRLMDEDVLTPRAPERGKACGGEPVQDPAAALLKRRGAPIIRENAVTDGAAEARAAGVDVDELSATVEEIMHSSTMSAEISDPPKKKNRRADVDKEAKAVEAAVAAADTDSTGYEFPPVDLLRTGAVANIDARDEIMVNKERLEGAIHSFGINAAIVGVTRGPTVTRFDIA